VYPRQCACSATDLTRALHSALHIKFWPLKCVEDNVLRSCAEVHVLLTIVMAFIMKASDAAMLHVSVLCCTQL
jgi:hypothetical protein